MTATANKTGTKKSFFETHEERKLPSFTRDELALGSLLGTGGFCMVHEIVDMRLVSPSEKQDGEEKKKEETVAQEDLDDLMDGEHADEMETYEDHPYEKVNQFDETESRLFMKKHSMRKSYAGSMSARYAIKRLKVDSTMTGKLLETGLKDLEIESKVLRYVDHPNIIKMRATANVSPSDKSFFLVLDRLYGTLEERIGDEWTHAFNNAKLAANAGLCFGICGKDDFNPELDHLWLERLLAAYDLASALRYLHKNRIIYRDLKPENIGFDIRGDIKLFDFGFAKELPLTGAKKGLYKLTGVTGSRRYMAPEVALCQPYNLKADVYSFSIVLWEICSLKEPFPLYDVRDHMHWVVKQGIRPKVHNSWPISVRDLMKECWSVDIKSRPSFDRIARVVRGEAALHEINPGSTILDRTKHMMDKSNASRQMLAED
mmetsp:Transcript_8252/g.12215  ORF Transcript_8252/g.12215 Transcript_8252/m.12215 type:complete len:431 (+) Transcript_8252:101-1393(+)|eukprot:CAMPEP_0196813544 /NCGR_PEP_ID=MMETSP1362-20130617/37502_1 /TAXON_ID=163516 /ORGANISM="Leptocylindrus danicus, Strain CCMP1856" /LENGTH=430 /DNA_ID=CAMNT_0042189835 /DNA_START=28 /DNA_END=1320 /DNA_ORIENTATION=+